MKLKGYIDVGDQSDLDLSHCEDPNVDRRFYYQPDPHDLKVGVDIEKVSAATNEQTAD